MKSAALPSLRGLLPLVAVLVLWELLSPPSSPNFPPPSQWWNSVTLLVRNGSLWPALLETTWTFAAGLGLACAGGFALGLLIGTVETARRWSSLLLECLRALPPPVIIPIAVLVGGYTPSMKIAVIAIPAAWPILLNTVSAVAAMPAVLMDVSRSLRMTWVEFLTVVVIPGTIPALLLGVRVSLSLAIVTTLLTEMFTGLPGIGVLMMLGQRNYDSAQVFGMLAVVGVMAFLLTLIFSTAEAMILRRWPPRHSA